LGVIRRADDFFLFENAVDSSNVVDMTYETFNVENVKARGAELGFAELPQDIPLIVPPPILAPPELPSLQTNLTPIVRIDLPTVTEKQFEIVVYRVHFDDLDSDGYADDDELPTSEEVLSAQEIELHSNQESFEPAAGFRIKIESFPSGSGTPTGQQIEELKAKLLSDPDMPTGAYSIVKTNASESETVLDIFAVRDDSTEDHRDDERVPLVRPLVESPQETQVPFLPKEPVGPGDNDSSLYLHSSESLTPSRFATLATTGALAAALWYSRRSADEDASLLDELGNKNSQETITLTRSARRVRRIADLLLHSTEKKSRP
jgi:hypothetical protein